MQNLMRTAVILLGTLGLAGLAAAAITARVYEEGMGEGNTTIRYRIVCSTDARTQVDLFYATGEVCYVRVSDNHQQCLQGITVDQGAVKACSE